VAALSHQLEASAVGQTDALRKTVTHTPSFGAC
jgi:hypothetical protein